MRAVLDTGILWDTRALRQLQGEPFAAVLPAVAFTERARQILQAGRDLDELEELLRRNGISIEDFTPMHGLRYAAALDQRTWDAHSRDALIAGHVGPDDLLWTRNPRDFEKVGLSKKQIVPF